MSFYIAQITLFLDAVNGGKYMCFFFQSRPFWLCMRVPNNRIRSRYQLFFGNANTTISERGEAQKVLLNVVSTIQEELLNRIKSENSYDMLMKLYYIFDEVHSFYLNEKEARTKFAKLNVESAGIVETFVENRNIMRNIIDACNVWIENCILYQHNIDTMSEAKDIGFKMDIDLMIDLYLYGFASQGISLLSLSKNTGQELYYGLEISPTKNIPADILKYHPIVFSNPVIAGNQNNLVDVPLHVNANDTDFGIGFSKTYGVEFLLFLAAIKGFQDDLLRGDEKSLTVISKKYFISLIENYTKPKIDGECFYNSFVLDKNKLEQQLRRDEEIIWIMGANKERHEIRPFIGLEDGNILISYAATEQAKQLWVSYFSNGGMCYSNITDDLSNAMNKRNQELSDILVSKIREVLNKHYTAEFDEKDVKYQRIFGNREIDYGDFDVVYYVEDSKELFLIEAKYFSDSLNSSGMVTDYRKLFEEGGYYEHCKRRYDLVLSEPTKMKDFVNATGEISAHLIFLSSKPIELELQDDDGVVTFLSLDIFDKYIRGNLINEDDTIARPTITI